MTGAVLYTNSAGLLTDYSHHGVNGVPDNTFRITPDLTLLGRKVRVPSDVNYLGTPTTGGSPRRAMPRAWSTR